MKRRDERPLPDDLRRNLATEHQRLAELERVMAALLAGETPEHEILPVTSAPAAIPMSYGRLTADNDELRAARGWSDIDLDEALTPAQRNELAAWRAHRRLGWDRDDILVVGLAGVVGTLATVFDQQVDAQVRGALGRLKDTPLLKGWENDARRMPIDYTGPDFGGPGHRVRSAGHDLGRPLAALKQIRDGQFRGVTWTDGVRTDFSTVPGRYSPVEGLGEALVLWLKHLAADFVTPMSLPLPGWTHLYEMDDRALRRFAHDVYQGPDFGNGVNLRSAVATPMLSVLSTEAIVRTHVHLKAYRVRGTLALEPNEVARRDELLLAAHAVVGAACLGHALVAAFAGEGPLALRHVNAPVLLRTGHLAAKVRAEARKRERLRPPTWEELLVASTSPWMLDEAEQIDVLARALSSSGS